jgi:hypothetical protein
VGRIAVPLEPALDRIAAVVAAGTVPIHPTVATGMVAATGAASAGVSSLLGVLAVLGVEAPPAAVSAAGASGAVAVASELVEFYLIACVARDGLARAGLHDPALLRRVLIETYLDGDRSRTGSFGRVAGAVVRRALPRMVPVVGVPLAARSSLRDLRRARAAVARLATRLG